MSRIRTSLKKHYKLLIFLLIIFIIGLISGFIYFNLINDNIVINLKEELLSLAYNTDNFIFHSIILSLIIIFSFLLIGSLFGLFIYFYEGMSIGFIFGAFLSFYNVSGFIYGLFYCLIFKVVYVLCFTVILIKVLNFSKNIIGYFILKKDMGLRNVAIDNFVAIIKCLFLILINDIILLFMGDNLISIFSFLISK